MKIVHISAGAAGMICGSCLHDNTLARFMIAGGAEVLLTPLYTPLRTDEANVSQKRIFYSGINVFLQQYSSLFRATPRWFDRLFESPKLISFLTGRAASTDPKKLGPLTLSMLRGKDGRQKKELSKLLNWLEEKVRPDVVHLSNLLLIGLAKPIRETLKIPVVCTLSGEDIFLDQLEDHFCIEADKIITEQAKHLDAAIALNQYYADFASKRFDLPLDQVHIIRHGLDLKGFQPKGESQTDFRIGYFARLCPEKGLHHLVDAFIQLAGPEHLANKPGKRKFDNIQLAVAGYLGHADRPFFEQQKQKLAKADLLSRFSVKVEPTRKEKIDFLSSLDVMALPAIYRESKGISVLEAWAAGLPVVLPDHGAFPEMIEESGGGEIYAAGKASALECALVMLIKDRKKAVQYGKNGRKFVEKHHTAEQMAETTLNLYRQLR